MDIRLIVSSAPETLDIMSVVPGLPFQIYETEARTILSPVSGFLRDAGFTHSLTPLPQLHFRLQLLLRANHARPGRT